MTTSVVHLVIGPAQHGVVRHGTLIAGATGDRLVRIDAPAAFDPETLGDTDVVHVPFTDRLFGADCDTAAAVFEEMAARIAAVGPAVSVTLHDLPDQESDLGRRRTDAYRRVVRVARGVVVNSPRELQLLEPLGDTARSRRMIPLPLEPPATGGPEHDATEQVSVVVLGFLFPDRGYEHTIDELPDGVDLSVLGRPSEGHDELVGVLTDRAALAGHRMTVSGFVPDDALSDLLYRAAVPVAPNRRVTASASIATWLAHRRRPLVPRSPYTEELARQWPQTLSLYDADVPGELRSAIARAVADPRSTWLADGVRAGIELAEVAAMYRTHFAGCAPERAVRVSVDRWIVPGNRWDLLDERTPEKVPTVSVVIPYYEAQRDLDLVLTALSMQTHPAGALQVVVADDGSSAPPDLGAATGSTVLVRQPNAGFRAAAARNLGAAASDGSILVFLDGDTIPEPDYVRRLTRLPALSPDALTVGRRRHAELSDLGPDRLSAWLHDLAAGRPGEQPPVELEEPGWLRDAYSGSGNLLHADRRSYRHIISAVLGLHRDLFDEIGGFSEDFTRYGGEDWELAHRAWVAGAVFAHVPEAVAWHNGPDWAGRNAGPGGKNDETLTLTGLLPDPVARGGGQWLPYPAIVVVVAEIEAPAMLAVARSAFAGGADCGFFLIGPSGRAVADRLGDARIKAGQPSTDVLARAQTVVELERPASLTDLSALAEAADSGGPLRAPIGTVAGNRARQRARRWATSCSESRESLQAMLFGGRDTPSPVPVDDFELARELGMLARRQPFSRS